MGNVCGYLDIETTGLSPWTGELTVIGLYVEHGQRRRSLFQPFGKQISPRALKRALSQIDVIYTYNGSRFDLPFIKAKLGIAVEKRCRHEDLMYSCWRHGLRGGFKAVERSLGISRETSDVDGWMAIQLWKKFRFHGDQDSLLRLLAYNREDVVNLSKLRTKLLKMDRDRRGIVKNKTPWAARGF